MDTQAKSKLRESLRQRRNELTEEWLRTSSLRLRDHLVTVLQSRQVSVAAAYYPYRNEPDLTDFWVNGKRISSVTWCLPVCVTGVEGEYLRFAYVDDQHELVPGKYNIPVPHPCRWCSPDVILVPCLGFNRSGFRLGYGAGWYDKTLALLNPRPLTVGIAWSHAEVSIPFEEPHDIALDYVVTEEGVVFGN